MSTTNRSRIIAVILAVIVLFGVAVGTVRPTEAAEYAPAKALPSLSGKTTQQKVVAIAQSQIGYAETVNNKTVYGKWFHDKTGKQGYCAWCAIFISWVLMKADAGDLITYTYTAGAYSFGLLKSQYGQSHSFKDIKDGTYVPQPGDIISYYDEGSSNTVSSKLKYTNGHVGIVISANVDKAKGKLNLVTVDGNWGDKVSKRTFSVSLSNGKTGLTGGNAYVYAVSNPGYNLYDDVQAFKRNAKSSSNMVLAPKSGSVCFFDNPSNNSKTVVSKYISGKYLHASVAAKNAQGVKFYLIDKADDAKLIGKYVSEKQVTQVNNKTPKVTVTAKGKTLTAKITNVTATGYSYIFKDNLTGKTTKFSTNVSTGTFNGALLRKYTITVSAYWVIGGVKYTSSTATATKWTI